MVRTKGPSHGTARRYQEGCTCDECTDNNTARNAVGRARRATREPPVHNASTYRNWGCTCPVCREANRVLMREKQTAAGRGANRCKEWTDKELAIALERKDGRRYAQTALAVALQLGRSVSAVNRKRANVKSKPAGTRVDPAADTSAPSGENQ